MERFPQPPLPPESEKRNMQAYLEALLVEEEQLVKESKEFTDPTGSAAKSYEALVHCPSQTVKKGFREMVERLDRETDVIAEISDTIGKDNLLKGLVDATYPIEVSFDHDKEVETARGAKQKIFGIYQPQEKVVHIADSELDPKILWMYMTLEVPQIIRTLDHEIVHHWFNEAERTLPRTEQESFKDFVKEKFWSGMVYMVAKSTGYARRLANSNPYFENIATRYLNLSLDITIKSGGIKLQKLQQEVLKKEEERLLSEIVAQKSDRVLRKQGSSTTKLLEDLTEGYGYDNPSDKDKIIVASQIIDRLRVLGYGDKEIAKKLAGARWDKRTTSFPHLDREIEVEAEQKGMTLEDLDTKADVIRIEKRVDILRSTKIAREELEKTLHTQKKLV